MILFINIMLYVNFIFYLISININTANPVAPQTLEQRIEEYTEKFKYLLEKNNNFNIKYLYIIIIFIIILYIIISIVFEIKINYINKQVDKNIEDQISRINQTELG